MCVSCLLFFRVQRKVVSLCVYRDGEWLHHERDRDRHDSINTIVMRYVSTRVSIPISDHKVLVKFRYPVHSSLNYK